MSTTYNLTLTTAEAYTLKNFLQNHMPKHTALANLSDDARAIGFIHDRIPDVTPGQQTFTNEKTFTNEQTKLCLDIIYECSKKRPGWFKKTGFDKYIIQHPHTKEVILSAEKNSPFLVFVAGSYEIRLYTSRLNLTDSEAETVFKALSGNYYHVLQETLEARVELKQKQEALDLKHNISKAKDFLKN